MPIFSEIRRIKRLAESDVRLGAGFQRTRSMKVLIELNSDAWGQYLPDAFLTDDRLPALYSSYPYPPYPSTDTVTPATFTAYDTNCLLYDVGCSNNNSNLSQIVYDYQYFTNPPTQPGNLPPELRRDQGGSSPPGNELGYTFSIGKEEFELPYRSDASTDPRAFITGVSPFPVPLKVLNSAGERYEQQPTRKLSISVLTVNRLELEWRRKYWESWGYVKNRFYWNDLLPGEALSFPVTVGPWQLFGTAIVYPVTYTIKWLDKESQPTGMKPAIESQTFWDDVILSYGYKQLIGGKLLPISIAGTDSKVPYPLDATGRAINPPDSAEPASLTYLKSIYKDFEGFGFTLPPDLS